MADRIQVRRDTEADWTSNDPTLAAGEVGFVSDTDELVVGDGSTAFTSLDRIKTGGPWGTLGYASVTTAQTSITSEVDLTGLSVTVTAGSSRRLKITAQTIWSASSAQNVAVCRIKESTTTLQSGYAVPVSTGTRYETLHLAAIVEPSSGSHTYKLTGEMPTGTGSVDLIAATARVCFILVEDIGPV